MKEIKPSSFSPDVIELMALLYKNKVEYLIVGGPPAGGFIMDMYALPEK